MTPETLSIPVAPASGCCSDTAAKADGLSIVSDQPATADACCQSPPFDAGTVIDRSGEPCTANMATAESAVTEGTDTVAATEVPDDASLIDALRTVIDPELMINIVDLGLVYSINHSDRKALVEMTLTSPACPAGPQIISQAKMALEKVGGIDTAEIKLTMSPPWTPDRMTDDARDQLGIF
jgi:metal-sulfur cluster biosynthetic enzyme